MPTSIDQAGTALGSHAPHAGTATPVARVTPNHITWQRDPLDPSTPQFEPLHQIAFPGTEYIHGFAFSPDGEFIYCLVDGKAVNLWSAATSVWPEILGSLTALVVIVWLLIVLRVRARRQVSGKPYCRRCNYNIESHVISATPDDAARRVGWRAIAEDTVCPECGVNLTKRPARRGRSTIRRIWMPTAVVAAMVILFTAMHVAQVPRNGRFSDKYIYCFDWLDRLVDNQQFSGLLKHKVRVSKVMRVETRSGTIDRTLYVRMGFATAVAPISPDGRHLAYGDTNSRVAWADTHTGRVQTRMVHDRSKGQYGEVNVVGYSGDADQPWVYYGLAKQDAGVSQLRRWQPSTDEDELVVEEPAYLQSNGPGHEYYMAKTYRLLHRPEGTATMSAPGFMLGYHSKDDAVTVRAPKDSGGQVLLSLQIDREFPYVQEPAVTPDGERLILNSMVGCITYSLRTGELLDDLESRAWSGPSNPSVSEDGSRLFIVTHEQRIVIRDTRSKTGLAALNFPDPFIGKEARGSKDNRWVAAALCKSAGSTYTSWPYVHELFIYDVSKLNETLSPASPSSPPTIGTASPAATRSTQQTD